MEYPKINNQNVSNHLDRSEIVQETAQQIMKDFGMFGVEITFSGDTNNAYDELHTQLIDQISILVERNYDLLLSVLYQVDITEGEIAKAELPVSLEGRTEVLGRCSIHVQELALALAQLDATRIARNSDCSEKPD